MSVVKPKGIVAAAGSAWRIDNLLGSGGSKLFVFAPLLNLSACEKDR